MLDQHIIDLMRERLDMISYHMDNLDGSNVSFTDGDLNLYLGGALGSIIKQANKVIEAAAILRDDLRHEARKPCE